MAVGGQLEFVLAEAGGGKSGCQFDSAGPIVGVCFRVRAHAGIEQESSLRMLDDVAEQGVHPGAAGSGFRRRPDEVAEVDAPDGYVSHSVMVAGRTGPCWFGSGLAGSGLAQNY